MVSFRKSKPSAPPPLQVEAGRIPWRTLAACAFVIAFFVPATANGAANAANFLFLQISVFSYCLTGYSIGFGISCRIPKRFSHPRRISIFILGWCSLIIIYPLTIQWVYNPFLTIAAGAIFGRIPFPFSRTKLERVTPLDGSDHPASVSDSSESQGGSVSREAPLSTVDSHDLKRSQAYPSVRPKAEWADASLLPATGKDSKKIKTAYIIQFAVLLSLGAVTLIFAMSRSGHASHGVMANDGAAMAPGDAGETLISGATTVSAASAASAALPHGSTLVDEGSSAKTPSQIFQQASPSVVVVLTYNDAGNVAELGSGVKLANGDVATNCHVLKDGHTYRLRYQDKLYLATLAGADWDHDVCSLNAPDLPAPPVVLGSTKTLQVGALVYAIGTPEGLQLTLSEGIVSSLRPVGDGSYIQTTAAISPGSSGGGLFDAQGRLLGLTSYSTKEGQQLNFALPVEWIEALRDDMPRHVSLQNHMAPHTASIKHGTHHAASPAHLDPRESYFWSEVQWENPARALARKHNWQGVIVVAKAWVKAQAGNEEAWSVLGAAYGHTGQYNKSIEASRRALKIDSKDADAWYVLGISFVNVGKNAQAMDAYRHLTSINSTLASKLFIVIAQK